MSCYVPVYLPIGSWTDAQAACEERSSHLWTINSHEEWDNVFTKKLTHVPDDFVGQPRTILGAIFDPLVAPHFFIGLRNEGHTRKVCQIDSIKDLSDYIIEGVRQPEVD